MDAQLQQMKADISKLKAQASEASADSQIQINKEIEDLEDKVDVGENKLKELSDASGDALEELKSGLDNSWSELSSSVKSAASAFK
jgi:predicted  nucleic acid-binding Zn-ribbon protein